MLYALPLTSILIYFDISCPENSLKAEWKKCSRIPTVETQTFLLKSNATFHSVPKCNITSSEFFRTEPNINVIHNNRPSVIGFLNVSIYSWRNLTFTFPVGTIFSNTS
jgi:hypothetical protein